MTRPFTMIMLVAAAALAGCDNSDHTIVVGSQRARSDGQCRRQRRLGQPSAVDPGQQGLSLQGQQPDLRRLAVRRHRAREEGRQEVGTTVPSAKSLQYQATPRPLRSPTTVRAARPEPPAQVEFRTAPVHPAPFSFDGQAGSACFWWELNCSIRRCISSGGTSSTWVARLHWCPNGSCSDPCGRPRTGSPAAAAGSRRR